MKKYTLGKYTLGLKTGGLMEDPEWHIDDIRTIEANSLNEAKDKYAVETNSLELYDKKNKTIWGWSIVEVK